MKACNRKILELFYNAKHTGRISKPDAIGRVGEDDEGLVIELTWRVIGGVIAEAKFRAFANPNAIAITSLMVDNIIGKSVEDALNIDESVIIDNLGEFLPEYLEVYDMVRECIAEAYNNYTKRQNRTTSAEVQEFDYEQYRATHELDEMDEDEEFDFIKLQRELQVTSTSESTVSRGRGRPRKPVDPNAVVEVGEKRGRGRPRKEIDPNLVVEVGEKRGRGRPRKERPEVDETIEVVKRGRGRPRKPVDPNAVVEVGEKRGRGRPRKEVDPNLVAEVGEKRGRGRPRKERPETDETVEVVKRGRGRPRKEINPNEVVELGEKRGRGRPRKEIDPNAIVEVGEKRGRGRPRKEVDETEITEVGEKRGRGRPKKEVKYNFPTDLDEVIDDEEIEQLISGDNHKNQVVETTEEVEIEPVQQSDDDDDIFGVNYDVFKSNIRNILSGKEATESYTQTKTEEKSVPNYVKHYSQQTTTTEQVKDMEDKEDQSFEVEQVVEEVKRGRGRPRKEVDETAVEEQGEKRGRGRPKKIVIEEVEEVPSIDELNRPSYTSASSLTRSLSPASMSAHNTQDIVFASKNVTTTNININVTKTTTSVEDNKATSDDYSHNTTITQRKVEVSLPFKDVEEDDEEIEVETQPKDFTSQNTLDDFDDEEDDDIDDTNIKDEAPKGGIEDLLKALLDE